MPKPELQDPNAPRPRVLLQRYEVGAPIGQGGFATVYRGVDLRGGAAIALKHLRPTGDDRALRRELVALRYARVRGVVRMLDDLHLDDGAWIALELVDGAPFPGADLPPRPSADVVLPRAVQLLQTLARLHRLGLAHQDLKPGNVLVTATGEVHLLDLGLASAKWLRAARTDGFEGTVRYAAPEQRRALISGLPYDRSRADLYAAGALLYETFAGQPLFSFGPRAAWLQLVVADEDPAWPPLDALRPDLPADVVALVHDLLAFDPAARPASAAAALARLGVVPPRLDLAWLADLPEPASPADLEPLFHGPEPLLHLPSRAARCLHARTAGARAAVADELQAWIDGEFVTPDGDRLRVDRESLARLEHGVDARAPYGAPVNPADVAELLAARDLGDLGRGWPGLQIALLQARDAGDADRERELLVEVTATAIQLEDLTALDHGLRLLDDESLHPDLAHDCARLVRFWRASAVQRDPPAAAGYVGTLAPFADERLDAHRQGAEFMERLNRDLPAAEAFLDDLRAWSAGSDYREARRLTWLGLLRYRQLRFAEAAEAHRRSGELRTTPVERLGSSANELMALLEAQQFTDVRVSARRSARQAAALGAARFELLFLQHEASASYRLGIPSRVTMDLLEAALPVHPRDAILLAITAAAEAWRAGDQQGLNRIISRMEKISAAPHVRLPLALLAAIRASTERPTEAAEAEFRWAIRAAPPLVARQIATLAGLGTELTDALPAVDPSAVGHSSVRLEVLSVSECTTNICFKNNVHQQNNEAEGEQHAH